MASITAVDAAARAGETLLAASSRVKTHPLYIAHGKATPEGLSGTQQTWLKTLGKTVGPTVPLPDDTGAFAGALVRSTQTAGSEALQRFALGAAPARLPAGDYHLEGNPDAADQLALAWALGAYRFTALKSDAKAKKICRLKLPEGVDADAVAGLASAVYLGRDLINTPAGDLGPEELEAAARALARVHKATVRVVKGDKLLSDNFPMIHAVGRASTRAPRLVDLTWGAKTAPGITLVGKGIVFDTGGLNIKPGNSMSLMKKDMGGAATALALAAMIMDANLAVRLRVLLPIAENAVAGNAYRPGDVLTSRKGITVEIGNTDAEGRLVLADALALADDDGPDQLFCFATLTGAARVALGPELPPFYATSDTMAKNVLDAAHDVGDPLWRMPFWAPYDAKLKSPVADMNHITGDGYAGSVTAALFLKRFVTQTANFAHLDIFGWVPSARPGFPKGGEPQGARAVFESLRRDYAS